MIQYIILMAAAAAIFLWQSIHSKKVRIAKMQKAIREQWGGPTDCEYTYDDLQRIASYYNRHKKAGIGTIDDITWDDLDMDSMFLVMDRTFSFIGEEYLYYFLRTPVFDPKELEERQRLYTHFTENTPQREQLQELFYQVGKNDWRSLSESIYQFGQVENPGTLRHYIHAAALVASIGLLFVTPSVSIVLIVLVSLFNIITYYQQKADVEAYLNSIAQINLLLRCSEKVVSQQDQALYGYLEKLGGANARLSGLRKKSGRIQAGKTITGNPMDILMDYVRMLFHIDLIAFYQIVSIVKEHWQAVEQLMGTLGYLESCIAVASFRQWLPYYCVPTLARQNENIYEAEDLYHPLISNPVANSIKEDGCVLLTGSNASGKSTFLKAAALNVLLAQTAYTATCSSYRANYYRLYTSMSLRDSIESGDSYYMAEIKALKRILDAISEDYPVFCCVDEVLRGTNTVERIAASTKILERLSYVNVKCFAATHDLELTNLLEGRYHNYHFREEMEGDDITFHYVLHKGPATTRNAIRLLSILGYSRGIIEDAEAMANHFMETGDWEIGKE